MDSSSIVQALKFALVDPHPSAAVIDNRSKPVPFAAPAKVPDPEKRYQVEEKRHWSEERLAYYEREGLVLEAEKMRQLIRA
jgi:hypothetical protein